MAHLPTLPDPTPQRSPRGQQSSSPRHSEFSFTELSQLLGRHGAGSSSDDLALDLLLNDIVAQACLTTNATGAAIAMLRDGKFVCRATSGDHAPDLGSQLAADTGLSGACIQSGDVQHCEDTETDSRVDAEACRRLGVRSVVVVPLMLESEVVGVLEAFSPHAHVFTDSDVKTLRGLSRRIMETMLRSVEKEEGHKEKEEDTTIAAESSAVAASSAQPHRDPWTTVLAILILAVALLLGWMLGHRSLPNDVRREGSSQGGTDSVKAAASAPVSGTSAPSSTSNAASQTPPRAAAPKTPAEKAGGLAVYEGGKLVFQVKPLPALANSIAVKIPPDAAIALLIERIEPQYPDQARLSHIQGPVVLLVDVNEKGTVQELRALSGDPQLITAAVEAVKHWRFKPYAPRGEALNFQTQITVDFKLP